MCKLTDLLRVHWPLVSSRKTWPYSGLDICQSFFYFPPVILSGISQQMQWICFKFSTGFSKIDIPLCLYHLVAFLPVS